MQPSPVGAATIDPRALFSGVWRGEGQLIPRGPASLVMRPEALVVTGRGEWLSDAIWLVRERFDMASGWSFERRMFMELVGPARVRATADDMPLGADVELTENGFRFLPFRCWLPFRGLRFRTTGRSEAVRGPDGVIRGVVRLRFLGLPVAELRLAMRSDPSPA